MSNARKLEQKNIGSNHSPDLNLKSVYYYYKKYVYNEKLTNFRKTVETGVNPHLGGVAFHKVRKKMRTTKIMIMVTMMMIMMMTTMTFVGEGRGYFPQDWPIK